MRVARLFLLVGLFVDSLSVFSQQVINGSVIDKETRMPVPFASVGIVGTSKGTSTNLNGQFSLSITVPANLKITCVGYESLLFTTAEIPAVVELSPVAKHLNEVFVVAKAQNPRTLVRKAFANISENYTKESFLQTFFYRHYCKDDSVYGRLIEASVDVWKEQGYRVMRSRAGVKEGIRVTQLRRSLDKTVMAQGHEPISIGNLLQADIVAYQPAEESEHLKFYDETISLRTNFEKYDFTLEGATLHDDIEVYKITYHSKPDSILTTSGYIPAAVVSGSLYITMDNFAIIKYEDQKTEGSNLIRTSGYYRKLDNFYYPYHFVREGENRFPDGHNHSFHIELMSVDIRHDIAEQYPNQQPGKNELMKIPYDSSFWSNHTILKTTPLEDEIINHLGGGRSLNEQFLRYQQYEWSTTEGGKNGAEKFAWFLEDSKEERALYLSFITNQCQSYLFELEQLKKLAKHYRGQITFILIMVEEDEIRWKQIIDRYNLFADGILNYRIPPNSEVLKQFPVKTTPAFLLISRNGSGSAQLAKSPSDEYLKNDLMRIISSH